MIEASRARALKQETGNVVEIENVMEYDDGVQRIELATRMQG